MVRNKIIIQTKKEVLIKSDLNTEQTKNATK